MRRVLSTVLVSSGVLGLSLSLVGVTLSIGAAPASAAGKKVCTITDDRMRELSGLVATPDGYVVVNDSSEDESRERIFFLDSRCKLRKAVAYSGNGPRDPEDLALSPDGETLWIGDIGDNVGSEERRQSIALWSMPVSGASKPVLYRLTYPGGKPHDAEALLIGADGVPLIITKSPDKTEIYRPTGALQKNTAEGVPMEKVGEVTLPKSTTANPFGAAGRLTVTGAALAPDGKRVALRTYADAYEWDVQDGDLVKTLTTGTPRATPLADKGFGEAIAYTPDGKNFLTVPDMGGADDEIPVEILSYVPSKAAPAASDDDEGGKKAASRSWTDSLTLDDIRYLIAGLGLLGALLVGLGIFGVVRARRRRGDDGADASGPDGDDSGPLVGRQPVSGGDGERPVGRRSGYDDRDHGGWGSTAGDYSEGYRADRPADDRELAVRGRSGAVYGGQPGGGTVYGGGAPAGGRPRGGGYGAPPAGGAPRGGRQRGGGGVYGAPPGAVPPGGGRPPAGGGRMPAGGGRPRGGGGGVYGGPAAGGAPGGRPVPDGPPPGPPRGAPYGPPREGPGGPRGGPGAPRGGQYGQPRPPGPPRRAGNFPPEEREHR